MADNLGVTPGSGATMRSTEVSAGLHIQHTLAGEKTRVYDGVQSLALSGTASTLTVPGSSTHALVYAEGGSSTDYARYWHGSTPTASVGKKLKDHEEIGSAAPSSFQAIVGSGSITLRVEYYHYA